MANIIHVDDNSFVSEVMGSATPVVVDFWAEWCGPCRMLAPVMEDLAQELDGTVKVAKLNVDENQETAASYGVMSIPTLIVFKNGEEVGRLIGYQPKAQIMAQLKEMLALN